ncbi:hypothetical protein Dsin_032305 [Dipteronia sinensis]|uniref:Uncharacterized protein n=1 Tax=Dipteronia sinensis TaxID=43782 RepID=A0AAD9ZPF4_9ROSI|nr:hypothetical protein Dsin_032305 [Dipteronia sinensis]
MRKREKGREEKPSLPLAVAAARTSVVVAAARRRVEYFLPSLQKERERNRRDRCVAIAMENINYVDFLIKLRSSWIKKSTTNFYCNLNGLLDIVKIHVPGVTGANELHFLVGGKLAKFSQREFCLVTGLQFGVMSDIFLKPYAATKDGIHVRYFENDENIRLTDVWARFMAGGFDQPKDGLKTGPSIDCEQCVVRSRS